MTIRERLRTELKQRKIRQKAAGALAGLDEKKMSMILSGARRMTAEELLKLCMACGIDPAVFLLCDELDGVRARLAYLHPAEEEEEGDEHGERPEE